jgi:hypothetical protein
MAGALSPAERTAIGGAAVRLLLMLTALLLAWSWLRAHRGPGGWPGASTTSGAI